MPDSVSNVQTLDAQGAIGADFTGRVSADAVDLELTLHGEAVTDRNVIQWKRVTDGAARGALYATQLAGDTEGAINLYSLSPNGAHYASYYGHTADSGGANNRSEAWADGQGVKLIDSLGDSQLVRGAGFVAQNNFQGPWGTVPPPAGNSGVAFPIIASKGMIICWCTAFNTTTAGMRVGVYMNGIGVGDMIMSLNAPANAHTLLTPFVGIWGPFTPGGTGYVYYQTLVGNSDNADRGGIAIIQ